MKVAPFWKLDNFRFESENEEEDKTGCMGWFKLVGWL